MKSVGVIIGSTRTNRVGLSISNWFYHNSNIQKNLRAEILDLKNIDLPFYDEKFAPMQMNGNYKTEAGKKWFEMVKSYDSFVFVTPEYNFGIPATLKNAIDYVYPQWNDKPALIVSYGYGGGAGSSEALSKVLTDKSPIKMLLTHCKPQLFLNKHIIDENGQLKDINKDFEKYIPEIRKGVEELESLLQLNTKK